jgi:hypothetical protein
MSDHTLDYYIEEDRKADEDAAKNLPLHMLVQYAQVVEENVSATVAALTTSLRNSQRSEGNAPLNLFFESQDWRPRRCANTNLNTYIVFGVFIYGV